MEINEENLFSKEEATLIRDITQTLLDNISEMALNKVKRFANDIENDPVWKLIHNLSKTHTNKDLGEQTLQQFLEHKTKEVLEDAEMRKSIARGILKKLDTLTCK